MNKTATLAGVAQHAGVSTATVARVLKNEGYVSEETRLRVEAAVKETNYRTNAFATGLRTNRSLMIANLLQATTRNPIFAEIARGVEEEALRNGYTVILLNMEGNPERERVGVERMIERRVDAMIFTHALDAAHLDMAMAAGIPVVQVERLLNRPTSAVSVDNYSGCLDAIRHLTQLGHRRIGFVGGDPAIYGSTGPTLRSIEQERLEGYFEGLRIAGIGIDPELIVLARYIHPGDDSPTAYGQQGMRALLSLKNRPTAVLATAEVLVAGALQEVYGAGLRIPDDISVIGYDNSIAPFLAPVLTTVSQPMRAMGKAACELALSAIRGDDAPRTITFKAELQVRDSSGPVRSRVSASPVAE